MPKPTIKKGPASFYEAPGQTIREFSNGETGGLISLATGPDGALEIILYRLDRAVKVAVNYDQAEGYKPVPVIYPTKGEIIKHPPGG